MGVVAGLLRRALATALVPVVAFAGLRAKRLAPPSVAMPVHA